MTSVLIVRAGADAFDAHRVWGTGGWLDPDMREALDWLTLARMLGWEVRVVAGEDLDREAAADVVVVAGLVQGAHLDPDAFASRAAGGALVVARVDRGTELHHPLFALLERVDAPVPVGAITWGAGDRQYESDVGLRVHPLHPASHAEVWATGERGAIVVSARFERGRVLVLGFHPSAFRDLSPAMSGAVVSMLTRGAPTPVAWLDHTGTVALRMDDPGGAQNVYSAGWSYPKLSSRIWAGLGTALSKRSARMTIAYSAGWLDDGDSTRGRLELEGQPIERTPGTIFPSPLVRYTDLAGHSPGTVHDYRDEYRGIARLVEGGVVGVEAHGFTHIFPDAATWLAAPDRYESSSWFREFGLATESYLSGLDPASHPLALARAAIQRWFGSLPEVLIHPGDQWTNHALERALDLDFDVVCSYYLALRHDDRFCWATHVCSPYLDEPADAWMRSGLPTVGYLHDEDIARNGPTWFEENLEGWVACGARRFVDLRHVAHLLRSYPVLRDTDRGWQLQMSGGRPVCAASVGFRSGGEPPAQVGYEGVLLEVTAAGDGAGVVTIPGGHPSGDLGAE